MAPRKISGKLLALDITRGASYEELLERYDVTPQQMDKFFDGLVKTGRVEASVLPIPEYLRGGALRTCPKCGSALVPGSDECRSCGVFVSKFLKKRQETREKTEAAQETSDGDIPQNRRQRPQIPASSTSGKVIIGLFGVVLAGLIIFILSHPVKKPDVPIDVTPRRQAVVHIPPVETIPISARALADWYQSNEIRSDANYRGKVLEVTGIVRSVAKDILNHPYVSLKGSESSFLGVKCIFFEERASDLASLRSGQEVVIKGVCLGKMGVVVLDGCELMRK